jgi:hydroxymethylglutaryl-CoA reductase
VKLLEMLEPSAQELMQFVAVAGLAQNLLLHCVLTTGIQDGHMKMHLNNILNQFDATDVERITIRNHFKTNRSPIAPELIETLRK